MGQMLPIFVDEVPEYEARDGCMFVRWRGLEIALPIATCIQSMEACERALSSWQNRDAKLLDFPDAH